LLRPIAAGGDEPVPFRRAGVGPELEDAGPEPARLRLGDGPQVVDLTHGGVQFLAGLGGEAEDEVALDADTALGQSPHHRTRHLRGDPLAHVFEEPFAAGLDAEGNLAAPVAL